MAVRHNIRTTNIYQFLKDFATGMKSGLTKIDQDWYTSAQSLLEFDSGQFVLQSSQLLIYA